MSVTSNALLRHITIDACLRDTQHKYALTDLIAACTKAIKENSKVKLKDNFTVSTRTVQLDLQLMRDKKKGYNAPIVVYEQKYYKYKDPGYSIGNASVKQTNLAPLSEIAEALSRYSRISGMESLDSAVSLIKDVIENKVNGSSKRISIPSIAKPAGGQFFDVVKDAVMHRRVLSISYSDNSFHTSFEAIFYPLYMTAYANRWYVLGYEDGKSGLLVIALDTITSYSYSILPFPPNYTFDAEQYFSDIIGVSRPELPQENITFSARGALVYSLHARPVHRSQKLVRREENGECIFSISVIPNEEFYRWAYENQPNVTVLSPRSCGIKAAEYIRDVIKDLPTYELPKPKKEPKKKKVENADPDLFSGLF